MPATPTRRAFAFTAAAAMLAGACDEPQPTAPAAAIPAFAVSGAFAFAPLSTSATCTVAGGDPDQPLVLPAGFAQTIVATEPDIPDVGDMNTQNETGEHAGRYLYRTHEMGSNGAVSVTDLWTGQSHIVAQRADWERLDGIRWTPWKTILFAEETGAASIADPDVPAALAGLVYELDPATGTVVARPAVGSRSHEGLAFDPQGNLYGISETGPGYIFKFVPSMRGDLSSGQLYALQVNAPTGDRVGGAVWLPLDETASIIDSNAAAGAAGATGYSRPEDIEIAANILYVAITGENRVLAVILEGGSWRVSDYVVAGVNAPSDFSSPDNLAMDHAGNLYIAEDPGGSFPGKTTGDDIWVATPGGRRGALAAEVVRFASLTDCDAEPTGVYFGKKAGELFVNVQHRGGDGADYAMLITRASKH